MHPPHYRAAESNDYIQAPLGTPRVPLRLLQVHDGVPTGTIRGLAFRLNENQPTIAAMGAVVEIHMSTALTTSATTSTTFDANHGIDRTTVLPATVIQFPVAAPTLAPRAFTYEIALQQPFMHGSTASLCWDMRVSNRSTTATFYFDKAQVNSAPGPTMTSFGTGCTLPGVTQRMTLNATGTTSWPSRAGRIRYTGANMPISSSLVALSVGGSSTTFAGIPLPLELPGSATAPSGPCTIYNDSLIQVAAFTTATRTLVSGTNLSFGIHPSMNGLNLFTQALAFDAAANPMGVVTSNSVQFHVTAPAATNPVTYVYVDTILGATGTRALANGVVTRFSY